MDATPNFKRYNRQIILPEIGISGQQKLLAAKVLIIGAGGLGCPVSLYLSGAGIGHIGIIDHDVVDESNLQRQILYHQADIGKNKATVAAQKLQLFNPDLLLTPYPFKLTDKNANEIIEKYDIVIDGSDNFPTRYLVNDTCVALNKPLIFGSIFQFEGQISVFNYKGGPDYRNLYPEPPANEDTRNCNENGVIGTLPGIIGILMANETIKIVCGFGETLSGKLLTFDAINNLSQVYSLRSSKTVHIVEHSPVISLAKPDQEMAETTNKVTALQERFSEIIVLDLTKSDEENVEQQLYFPEITIQTLQQWKAKSDIFCLIDVRETYEFEEYNIGGINIPLYELKDQIDQLPLASKNVLCCSGGYRSKIAKELIMAKKYRKAMQFFSITLH